MNDAAESAAPSAPAQALVPAPRSDAAGRAPRAPDADQLFAFVQRVAETAATAVSELRLAGDELEGDEGAEDVCLALDELEVRLRLLRVDADRMSIGCARDASPPTPLETPPARVQERTMANAGTSDPRRPLERVLDALHAAGSRGRDSKWTCPAHSDSTPSLSVHEGDDGRVLLKCHAGCDLDAILAALGLQKRDLFLGEPPRHRDAAEPIAFYKYLDEHGRLAFEVVRYPGKEFKQCRPDGKGGRIWNVKGVRLVPYRLPELLAALAAGDTVYIVEGEKDADVLHAAGHVATSNPMGAEKWRDDYSEHLRETTSTVCIIADKDAPGYRHAAQVQASLRRVGVEAEAFEVTLGKDAADLLAARGSVDDGIVSIDAEEKAAEAEAAEVKRKAEATVEFADLLPLDEARLPDFPLDSLPSWLREVAERIASVVQVPVDLPAMAGLGALATAAAMAAAVYPKARSLKETKHPDAYTEPLCLYLLLAAEPGTRKTELFRLAKRPLVEWETAKGEELRKPIAKEKQRIAQLRARKETLTREAAKPSSKFSNARYEASQLAEELAEAEANEPFDPRLVADDITPETLAVLMCEQRGRGNLWCAEGGELFEMIRGRYAANQRANMGIYLKGHSGEGFIYDRRGRHLQCEKSALTIVGTVQPEVLRKMSDIESARDRGLLARFVFVVPETTVGSRSWTDEPIPESEAQRVYEENIAEVLTWSALSALPLSITPRKPIALVFDAEARAAWLAYHGGLEARIKPEVGDLAGVADWVSKLSGLTARFAGLLHIGGWVLGGPATIAEKPIDLDTMKKALALGEYALAHALYVLRVLGADEDAEKALKLWRAIKAAGWDRFKRQELWQRTKGGRIDSAADFDGGLGVLLAQGYLAEDGGEYVVNPAAKAG